jgi:hypothetical protein
MIKITTTAYKFKVTNDTLVFDLTAKTDIGLEQAQEKITDFFTNFKIINYQRITAETLTPKPFAPSLIPVKEAQPRAEPIHKKWGKLRQILPDQFSVSEYTKALRDLGYEYTEASWGTIQTQQLKNLVKLGKIKKLSDKPSRYEIIKVDLILKDNAEKDALVASLKEGKKVLLGTH